MGANRFLGFLNWVTGRQKPDKVRKVQKRRARTKPKYLITFEAQENTNGNFEKTTVIIRSDIEKFLQNMQSQTNKFNIIFMIKL